MVKEEINSIVEKYLFKPNTEETKNRLISEIKSFLNQKIHENIVESYGEIEVRMRDKDTIFLNINPEIIFKTKKVKYLYRGKTIDKIDFILENGKIYDVECDIFTLEPIKLFLQNGYRLPPRQSGSLGRELFLKMFKTGDFIKLADFREQRIDEILKD